MRFRFIQAVVFLLLVASLDRSIGWMLQVQHAQCQKGSIGHTNQVMTNVNTDLLIIGSSRASHHYVSRIIEDEVQLNCFNAGADGSKIDYHAAVYYANVARYQPKIVLIDVNEYRFTVEGGGDGNLRILAPYLGMSERVDRLFYSSDRWAWIKTLSAIYPYNSELADLMTGGGISVRDKGYEPLEGRMNIDERPGNEHRMLKASPDQEKLDLLEEILMDASGRKITIILIQSPRFTNAVENNTVGQIAELARKHNAYFINDINHPDILSNAEYFKDPAHLNHQGAEAYTRIVAGYLRCWSRRDGSASSGRPIGDSNYGDSQ